MDTSVCGRCGYSREGSTMMAEGDGEVKREAVEAGAGACTRPDHFMWRFSGPYAARERRSRCRYEGRAYRHEWRQRQ